MNCRTFSKPEQWKPIWCSQLPIRTMQHHSAVQGMCARPIAHNREGQTVCAGCSGQSARQSCRRRGERRTDGQTDTLVGAPPLPCRFRKPEAAGQQRRLLCVGACVRWANERASGGNAARRMRCRSERAETKKFVRLCRRVRFFHSSANPQKAAIVLPTTTRHLHATPWDNYNYLYNRPSRHLSAGSAAPSHRSAPTANRRHSPLTSRVLREANHTSSRGDKQTSD